MRRWLPWIAVVVVSAVVGTLGDELFHHRRGVVEYPTGAQEWWVPLVFGGAAIAVLGGYRGIAGILPAVRGPEPDGTAILHDALWLLAAYWVSGMLMRHPVIDALLLLGLFLGRMPWRLAPASVFNAFAVAIGGALAEVVLVRAGLFSYAPGLRLPFLGIPMWLPALYLHVGLLGETLSRRLAQPGTAEVTS